MGFSLNPFKNHANLVKHTTPRGSIANRVAGGIAGGGNRGGGGGAIPAWQAGVKGAGPNPAAAQNPMNRQTAPRPQGFGGMMGRVAQAAAQRRAAPTPAAPPTMSLGGGQPGAGVRVYSDGGKVYDRKPNGKKC